MLATATSVWSAEWPWPSSANGSAPSHTMSARLQWRWYDGGTGKLASRSQLAWTAPSFASC